MPVNKEHKEFHAVDMSTGWETPPVLMSTDRKSTRLNSSHT